MEPEHSAAVDLYWIPLGAGGHCVRFNGKVYEALFAARERRPRRDLYHAGDGGRPRRERFTIELAPSPAAREASRGAIATGPVGARWAGRLRLFRYEIRCSRGGTIPDLADAVGGPHRLSHEAAAAQRVLDLMAEVPTPVWGRDELHAGEGWNYSVIAWLIARAGLAAVDIQPPLNGRAPGWDAGLEVARRDPDCGFSRIAAPRGSGSRRVDPPDGRGVVRRQHAH